MEWTLAQGVEFCRSLQTFLRPLGFGVALTGGVLLKGDSDKDLDLIVYPFKKQTTNYERLRERLLEFGLSFVRLPNHGLGYPDDGKDVQVWQYQGKRIDLFFLS